MAEKTEDPTPKRLEEARRRGEVPRSKTLDGAFGLVGALIGGWVALSYGVPGLRDWTVSLLSGGETLPAQERVTEGLLQLGWLVGPPLLGAAATTGVGLAVTRRAGFRAERLEAKWERIDPIAGAKRLFSLENVIEVGRALALFAILGAVAGVSLHAALGQLLQAVWLDGVAAFVKVGALLSPTLVRCAFLLAALGALDLLWSRHLLRRRLRMTLEEVKREHKEAEGDPQLKGQRRSRHLQMGARGPARGLKKATALVVNPTHIAIALRWAPEESEAPYLVAKGTADEAAALRRQARLEGIPIYRHIPLARSLFRLEVGEEIPEELYEAAIDVIQLALESRPSPAFPEVS